MAVQCNNKNKKSIFPGHSSHHFLLLPSSSSSFIFSRKLAHKEPSLLLLPIGASFIPRAFYCRRPLRFYCRKKRKKERGENAGNGGRSFGSFLVARGGFHANNLGNEVSSAPPLLKRQSCYGLTDGPRPRRLRACIKKACTTVAASGKRPPVRVTTEGCSPEPPPPPPPLSPLSDCVQASLSPTESEEEEATLIFH